MKARPTIAGLILLVLGGGIACTKPEGLVREAVPHKDDYQQAYIYRFSMIAAYKQGCPLLLRSSGSDVDPGKISDG